ncbi:fat storage-inducing transmembrane protein 1 [Carcharodon carcharias]|uniref:fat storage-inducing transmembrane protein 1 n=1 Tax=Carcharodon carcharias TaxID=13397 RepID=UPI001B7F0873|nr:fat storage-inducing transmembrane protein 1 [Carcharodon carcharias]
MFLQKLLVWLSDGVAAFLGSQPMRSYYHLWLACLVIFGPLLQFHVNPRLIFANKRNYFHVRLVESAWSWTLLLTGGYLLLLAYLSSGSLLTTLRHFSRLTVGTGLRLLCDRAFSWLEAATGSCFRPTAQGLLLLSEPLDRDGCLRQGHVWLGYRVSAESFLLTYASLVLAEELSAFKPYLRLRFPAGAPLRLLYLLAATLLLLWNALLLASVVFFHQYSQKIVAAGCAQLCWHLTYRRWYLTRYSPPAPTHDLLLLLLLLRPGSGPHPRPGRRCVCGAGAGGEVSWESTTETLLCRE